MTQLVETLTDKNNKNLTYTVKGEEDNIVITNGQDEIKIPRIKFNEDYQEKLPQDKKELTNQNLITFFGINQTGGALQLSDGLIKANLETLKKERPKIFSRDKEKG